MHLVNSLNSGNALLKSLAEFDFGPFTKATSLLDSRTQPEGSRSSCAMSRNSSRRR